MSYPTYRQDFEGGTTLGTACPELIPTVPGDWTINTSSANSFTGNNSASMTNTGSTGDIISNINDTLGGDITLSGYFKLAGGSNQIFLYAQRNGPGTSYLRLGFGIGFGIQIRQVITGTPTILNTPLSSTTLPTGVWLLLEIRCHGSTISARVVRQDSGEFFINTGTGSWSSPNTPPAYDGSNSGTSTLTEAAGGFGVTIQSTVSCFTDDLIIEPAVPAIDHTTFTIAGSAAQQLTAGGFTDPLNGVTWSSSNTGVATVNSAGLVTGVSAGTATITATGKRDTGQTATATATVTAVYTLTSPSPASAITSVASGNFTVQALSVPSPALVVTPSDSGGGGTFTPTSLSITDMAAHTFTYTNATDGVYSISCTHTGGGGTWTNPGAVNFAVTAGYFDYTSSVQGFASGLSTVGYTILWGDLSVYQTRTTSGVKAGSAGYAVADLDFPTVGTYLVQWDNGASPALYAWDTVPAASAITGTVNANIISVLGVAASLSDGTAQAGSSSTTIVLASTDSATNNIYVGRQITLVGGTGVLQARYITAYVGSTKTATVHRAWDTTPDATSQYRIDILTEANMYQVGGQAATASAPVAFPASIGTSTFAGGAVASVTGAVGSVTGNVGGSVGSVTGSVGSVATNVTVGGYATGFDPATQILVTPGQKIVTDGSGRVAANATQIAGQTAIAAGSVTFPSLVGTSTYAGGPVASVTGNVVGTIGGYASGQDPATLLLVIPANKIATDSSNRVTAASVAGSVGSVTGAVGSVTGAVGSVTGNVGGNLVGTIGGYASGQDPATLLLAISTNKIATDSSGRVTAASVVANVNVNLAQIMSAPRDVSAVADSAVTLSDALWGGYGAGYSRIDTSGGNTVSLVTAATHTALRTFTVDSLTDPTFRH